MFQWGKKKSMINYGTKMVQKYIEMIAGENGTEERRAEAVGAGRLPIWLRSLWPGGRICHLDLGKTLEGKPRATLPLTRLGCDAGHVMRKGYEVALPQAR